MSQEIEADHSIQWLLPPSIDDMLPQDHPARFIYEFVQQIDLEELGLKFSDPKAPGKPRYSSRMLLRVWLYGWMQGIKTHRRLEKACRENIALFWLTGMNYPDHNTLWRFWKQNMQCIKDLFRQSVKLAIKLDMVAMAFHAVDGTKIRPASSAALHKEDLEKLLARLEQTIQKAEQEIAQDQDQDSGCRMPEQLTNAKVRREQIALQLQELAQEDRKQKLIAEPEVEMIRAGGRTQFNYNAQAVVDNACGIIVAEDVVTDMMDTFQLVPMLSQVEENLGTVAQHTAADGGYSEQQQIDQAEQKQWNVTVPAEDRDALDNPLHSHHFRHDPQLDVLICPATGQHLSYSTTRKERVDHYEARVYRCPVCKTCPLASVCTSNKRGREIEVTVYRGSVLKQATKHKDGSLGQAMRQRLGTVEAIFGWIKQQLELRRFTVRGLDNVRSQWSLVCLTSNLSRIYRVWRSRQSNTSQSGLAA